MLLEKITAIPFIFSDYFTGNPEEKMGLMFNMYDLNKSGYLHRDEFKYMLS